MTVRQEYLARYLAEAPPHPVEGPPHSVVEAGSERRRQLLETQKLYPKDSVSWKNLQRQLEALE